MNREAMGLIVKRDDGSEIVNYDNPAFPSYIYDGWGKPRVTWEKVPHFHEDIELIAVKEGNENSPKIKALVDALKSDTVKKYIEDTTPKPEDGEGEEE